jgi:hypothetical protein
MVMNGGTVGKQMYSRNEPDTEKAISGCTYNYN